jgi:UDP-2-acetamido-3-amino-2,3-dideoxy-glucuronate N-acetyltransferase
MNDIRRNVLQVGLGGFGKNHLKAWQELGMHDSYWVADLDEAKLQDAIDNFGVPADRTSTDFRRFVQDVDVVDVVTATDTHFEICAEALTAGKDVFVEKPMTLTLAEGEEVYRLARAARRVLQVGYYYRYHPAAHELKNRLRGGALGRIRYASGSFMGFKRARTDVGVTHTDGVHFIDLFNWWFDAVPERCYAVMRDHFGRGLEDWSLLVLHYPDGAVAKIESGYIQPGRWIEKVVPNAMTTKEVFVCGTTATAELDFEQDLLQIHNVRHERKSGIWTPVMGATDTVDIIATTPIQMIAAELSDFLRSVEHRRAPQADGYGAGCVVAAIIEAAYRSAALGTPVDIAVPEPARV